MPKNHLLVCQNLGLKIVKNARMSSAMKGQLEDVRRVDVLINNLKKYSNFVDKFSDENYKSVSQISEPRGNSKYGYSAQINNLIYSPIFWHLFLLL